MLVTLSYSLIRFRWVYCQLEALRHCLPPSVRSTLAELPETLDETYERILQEIPKSNRVHTHRLLQCLTVVARPLGVKELAEVLAIDFTAGLIPKLNAGLRSEDQEQAVLSACSSLIAVVSNGRGDQIVQFSHFSVQEFLTSDRLAASGEQHLRHHHIRPEIAHTIMAQTCLGVLLQLDDQIDNASIQSYPLSGYAAEHFCHHVQFKTVMSHVQDGIDRLFDTDKPHFGALLWMREVSLFRAKHPHRPGGVLLYHVAENGLRDLVDLLILKRPADLCAKGKYGTPLHAALQGGHTDVSRLLVQYCVDVDIRGFKDQTPLHFAAHNGMLDIICMLVERNADVNSQDENGQTPLHRMISTIRNTSSSNYFEGLLFLLENNADVDVQDNELSTPLHLASSYGCLKATQMLLAYSANVHIRNRNGETPLHRSLKDTEASRYRSIDITRSLLECGADVDAQDYDRRTALHLASYYGNLRRVKLLLNHRANVRVRNLEGETPLHQLLRGVCASSDDVLDIMRPLLERGADADAQDKHRSTPLHLASRCRNLGAVRLLLEHGANANVRNDDGWTPLYQSLMVISPILFDVDLEIIRSLLTHGADVDAYDNIHWTPLHLASISGHDAATQVLLDHGANIHVRNNEGETPFQLASSRGHLEIMRLLSSHIPGSSKS
jgi:ankyrin repeat protein